MRQWTTDSERATRALGMELAAELVPAGLLLLSGDLGTGKTILTQGIAIAMGIDPGEVQSPSYTLIREHEGSQGRLIHIDLYRLTPEEVPALGLEEMLSAESVKVIEWAQRLPWRLTADLVLELQRLGADNEREIREIERRVEV